MPLTYFHFQVRHMAHLKGLIGGRGPPNPCFQETI
jgi:hypothetical protein